MLGHIVSWPAEATRRKWRSTWRAVVVTWIALALIIALVVPGVRRHIPALGPDATSVQIASAFLYQQQRSLGCEYAAVHIAATMVGHPTSEYDIEAVVPLHENPHKGYRGDILGAWGNTTDYGVYNEPLAAGLAALGIPHEAFYGGRTDLERHLPAGHPTVVWLGMHGEGNSIDQWDVAGERYQLTTWMHVMTAYGFDEQGVYLSDPGTAVWRVYSWDEFLAMWGVMDGMALSIMP
jgi:uncharacterized protein YvpB